MTPSRLRVGERVLCTGARAGALGRVALRLARDERDCEETPYLVRWETGGESRRLRASIRRLRPGDPIA